ncbi:MAG: GGDEF domain-containing protein [Saprospiraceae bacterium]|nr:GGDEF domain-containing protein [Pyrinomonadaceae bacterium]
MKFTDTSDVSVREMKRLKRLHFIFGLSGLAGVALTSLLASSTLDGILKLLGCLGVASAFLILCIISYRSQKIFVRHSDKVPSGESEQVNSNIIESKLNALDEANQFFGTSLKPPDMFRLISSRAADIFPFAASVLYLVDEDNFTLKLAQADGKNFEILPETELGIGEGVAGRSFSSRLLEFTTNIGLEDKLLRNAGLKAFRHSIAIPLFEDNELFGVYQLFTESAVTQDESTRELLDAIGERVAPIFRNSMAFERSLSNALTDPLTSLPNERAFFMVLENQLAESHRYRDDRPLTVLSIDIKDFADANLSFGHATGDRLLTFAAKLIKEQLRKMDFLARSVNDEFVVILPTANEKTALEILERIKLSFVNNPFEIAEKENLKIWLNYGWATFWKDGETAQQLLLHAQLRKQQAKSAEPSKVLWFPKEYVN